MRIARFQFDRERKKTAHELLANYAWKLKLNFHTLSYNQFSVNLNSSSISLSMVMMICVWWVNKRAATESEKLFSEQVEKWIQKLPHALSSVPYPKATNWFDCQTARQQRLKRCRMSSTLPISTLLEKITDSATQVNCVAHQECKRVTGLNPSELELGEDVKKLNDIVY